MSPVESISTVLDPPKPPFSYKGIDLMNNHLSFQSVLFLKPGNENDSGGTLSGNKRLVYVLMKIFKKCYKDVNITSFKVELFQCSNISKMSLFPDEVCSGQVSGGEKV